MTALAALFYAIATIAVLAIVCAMYLLDQRGKLRREKARLMSIARRQRRLRKRALAQRDDAREKAKDHAFYEERLRKHGDELVAERNLLRAQLIAYTEPSRFPVVTRGQA